MTTDEMSNRFDQQVNAAYLAMQQGNPANGLAAFSFDEYEKSLFLTEAQNIYVLQCYNGGLTGNSFEKSEESRKAIDVLLKSNRITERSNVDYHNIMLTSHEQGSKIYRLADDVWFVVYEAVTLHKCSCQGQCTCSKSMLAKSKTWNCEVVPVTYDQFARISRNPFRCANKRRCLRLDVRRTVDLTEKVGRYVEIVSKYPIREYYYKYLRKPKPIILVNLGGTGLEIEGETSPMGCELQESVHQSIVDAAVQLALRTRLGNNKTT